MYHVWVYTKDENGIAEWRKIISTRDVNLACWYLHLYNGYLIAW